MKQFLLIACFLTGIVANAQTGYPTLRNNGVNQTQEEYLINSPGNTPGNSRVIRRAKDSTYYEFVTNDIYLRPLVNTLDQPGAINFLYTDNTGRVKSSSLNRIYPDTNLVFPTLWYLSNNYYDKSQSDMRYIQNVIIDSQMVVNAVGPTTWGYVLNKSYHLLTDTPNLSVYATNARLNDTSAVLRASINSVNSRLNDTAASLRSAVNNTNSRLNDTAATLRTSINGKLDFRYIPVNIDSSFNNEIQGLSRVGDSIKLTSSTSVYAPVIAAGNITGAQNTKVTGSWPNIVVADSFSNVYYNTAGRVNQNIKIWSDKVTPSSSSGYSLNITSAGFTTILSVQLTAFENIGTEKGVLVSGKTVSTTAVTMNFYQSKTTGVLIGGSIDGLQFHSTPANITLHATVIGY